MPGFGPNRLQYKDTRTLGWNQRYVQVSQTSTYEAAATTDPAIDHESAPPDGSFAQTKTGYTAGVALAGMNRGRQPVTFRTTPGPGQGHFTPSGG